MSRLSDLLTLPSRAVPAAAPGPVTALRMFPSARLAAAALARMILTVTMSLTLWAAAPALLGWQPTTVASGSMEPHISAGDVVSARPIPSASLQLGMVLLVDDPDHPDRLRLHRLVRFNPDGRLTLRGDANPNEDSTTVERQAVHGVGALRVPYVATPLLWLHEKAWLNLIILVGLVLALVAATGLDRDPSPAGEPKRTPSGPDGDPNPTKPSTGGTDASGIHPVQRDPTDPH